MTTETSDRRSVLNEREVVKISAHSACSRETVRKWSRGERVLERTRVALERSAKALRIPVPAVKRV